MFRLLIVSVYVSANCWAADENVEPIVGCNQCTDRQVREPENNTTAQLEELKARVQFLTEKLMAKDTELENEILRLKEINEHSRANRQTSSTTQCNRVSFSAYMDYPWPGKTLRKPYGKTVPFNKLVLGHNEGGGFDKNTGKFTCPTNGVYLFTFTIGDIGLDGRDHHTLVRLYRDGKPVVDAVTDPVSDYHNAQGGNTAIIPCSKGQKVYLATYNDGGSSQDDAYLEGTDKLRFSTFSGVRLYSK